MSSSTPIEEVIAEASALGHALLRTHAQPLAQLTGEEPAKSRNGLVEHAERAYQQTGIAEFECAHLALTHLLNDPVRLYPNNLRRIHQYLADGLYLASLQAPQIDHRQVTAIAPFDNPTATHA